MALSINGTTGISGVDGSASAPALQGTDSNTGINFASDTVNINTGGVTRATVDSSGNVGIGTSTMNYPSGGGLTIYNATAPRLRLCNSSTGTGSGDGAEISIDNTSKDLYIENRESEDIIFYSGSERMRIKDNGYVGIGNTDPQRHLEIMNWSSSGSTAGLELGDVGIRSSKTGSSTTSHIRFYNSNGQVGSISTATSSTSFNTSSDYRLKENVVSISDGITRIKQLKPSKFNWISDETNTLIDGFLAHEVSSIVPESITGTKDAVAVQKDVDDVIAEKVGDPIYQTIDQSKLVPLLTAALQEAIAKIEVLETKVAALEAG
jgi:hypothetical protein